jgi:hypothetical protein
LIVTLNEQLDEPQEFVAVQITEVAPMLKLLPLAGVQFTVGIGVADGVENVTTELHVVISEEHEPIVGATQLGMNVALIV